MASMLTGNPTACWYSDACVRVASFFGTFFFQIKKKVERSPFYKRLFLKALSVRKEKSGTFSFYKRKELCPVGRQSKSQTAHSRPVGRHRKEPPQIPSAGICVNLTSGCHLFSKISNAFFRVFP
jgi:hypothetical protein